MSWERFTGVFVRGDYSVAAGYGYLIPGEWAGLDYESAFSAEALALVARESE